MSTIEQAGEKAQPELLKNISPLAVGDQKLERGMGVVSGTLLNVGQIIGAGIFSSPSIILNNCGSGGMMLVLWVMGAVFSATGVWNYLELGTMIPKSGGDQEYLAYEFPNPRQLAAYLFLILVGIFGHGAALAMGSVVFGDNIMFAIKGHSNDDPWKARAIGVFCLTVWLILSLFSTKIVIRTNNFFTFLKIGLLLFLICVGFAGFAGAFPNQPDIKENFSFKGTIYNVGSYANAIYFVIHAYGGWSNVNFVVDELKDPIKNLPRCCISSLVLVAILYVLANVAYLAVLPIDVMKRSDITVAANFFNTAFGGIFGGRILPILVGCSAFGFVGTLYYPSSRIVLEAARKGFLPYDRFFGKLNTRYQTPMNALVLIYVIAMIFLLAPPPGTVFQFVTAFSIYAQYFFCGLCVVGLLILRRTQPDIPRPIKAPIPVAIIFILVCLYTLVFVFVPPVVMPSYPYWLPYVVTILLGVCFTGLWYYKAYVQNAFENSYNAEILLSGQQELLKDVYGARRESTESITNEFIVDEKEEITHVEHIEDK